VLKEPHLFQRGNSNTTYYLQWDAPSNSAQSDLDRYLLYINDTLTQGVQANQRYAVVSIQNNVTTTVKIAVADTCGQVSSFSESITIPQYITNNLETNSVAVDDISIDPDLQRYSNSKHSIASLVLFECTAFLALLII
jgi:hypothetical protein